MDTPNSAGSLPLVAVDPQDAARALFNSLARQIACEIEKFEDIIARAGLTQEQYDEKVAKNPYFQKVLGEAQRDWKAAENAGKRSQIHAAYLFGDALPYLWQRAIDPKEPLSAVNESMKLLAKIGGVDTPDREPGTGDKFQININIGEGKVIRREFEAKTIDATTTAPEGNHNVKAIERTDRPRTAPGSGSSESARDAG